MLVHVWWGGLGRPQLCGMAMSRASEGGVAAELCLHRRKVRERHIWAWRLASLAVQLSTLAWLRCWVPPLHPCSLEQGSFNLWAQAATFGLPPACCCSHHAAAAAAAAAGAGADWLCCRNGDLLWVSALGCLYCWGLRILPREVLYAPLFWLSRHAV